MFCSNVSSSFCIVVRPYMCNNYSCTPKTYTCLPLYLAVRVVARCGTCMHVCVCYGLCLAHIFFSMLSAYTKPLNNLCLSIMTHSFEVHKHTVPRLTG